jgi:hypothetical protein
MLVDDISIHPFVSVNTAVTAGYTGKVYVLTNGAYDLTTNLSASTMNATPVGYFAGNLAGNTLFTADKTRLYLQSVTNQTLLLAAAGSILKQDYANTQQGTLTVAAACTEVTGVGTLFTKHLTVGAHFIFNSANAVVGTIANDTFLTTYAAVTNAASANTYATYPMGTIRTMVPRAIASYGAIANVSLTSSGSGYVVSPALSVAAMDAEVQALFYFNANTTTETTTDGRAATIFTAAELEVVQGAGQIKTTALAAPAAPGAMDWRLLLRKCAIAGKFLISKPTPANRLRPK